jgi:hypothetical protein
MHPWVAAFFVGHGQKQKSIMAKDTGFLQIISENSQEEQPDNRSDSEILFGDDDANENDPYEDDGDDDGFFDQYEQKESETTGDDDMDIIFGKKKEKADTGSEEEDPEGDEEEEEQEEEDPEGDEEEEQEEEDPEELPEWTKEIKDIFPDKTFDTMADYDAALVEHLNGLKTTIEEKTKAEEKLVDILNDSPELTSVIQNLAKGISLRVALIKAGFQPEDFSVSDDDDDAEELVKAKLERQEQSKKRREQEQAIQNNIKQSEKAIQKFQETKGIKDSVKEKFLNEVHTMFESVMDGKVTENLLESFWKALNYENDIKKAEDRGMVRGRNQKIVAEKRKKSGDGLPKLNGSTAKNNPKKVEKDGFADSLDRGVSKRPSGFLDILTN